jgi:hypothetical protein
MMEATLHSLCSALFPSVGRWPKVRTCCEGKKAFLADFQQRVREYVAEQPERFAKTITLIQELEERFAIGGIVQWRIFFQFVCFLKYAALL